MFLMIHIFISVLPIWKSCCIATLCLHRGIILRSLPVFFLWGFDIVAFVRNFLGSRHFHWVRINDFVFLFNVESVLWLDNFDFSILSKVLFLIISMKALGIWISYKSITTSISPCISTWVRVYLYLIPYAYMCSDWIHW